MADVHWKIFQHAQDPWSSLPDRTVDFENLLHDVMVAGLFELRHNPVQVSELFKKPVSEVTTINGKTVYLTPCVLPGQPLPLNAKLQIKIEHLRQEDYYRLKALYKYDLRFLMTTSNFAGAPNTLQGRLWTLKIMEFQVDQVAVRFNQQVYSISMTCRLMQ